MIREAILFGGVLYVLITVAQIIDRPGIWLEGFVVSAVLAAATAYYLTQDEHHLHLSEIIGISTRRTLCPRNTAFLLQSGTMPSCGRLRQNWISRSRNYGVT